MKKIFLTIFTVVMAMLTMSAQDVNINEIVSFPGTEIGYEYIERMQGGEEHYVWIITPCNEDFWESTAAERPVKGFLSSRIIYNDGRSFTNETYYMGEAYHDRIVMLMESFDGGETYKILETPVTIYPSQTSGGEVRLKIDGKTYLYQDTMDDF